MTYTVTVLDEMTGQIDHLIVKSDTFEGMIYKVESDPDHEYEVIEYEYE